MSEENAKAAQELAKATSKGLDILRDAAPFIERVFGPPVENAVGLVSDRLQYFRLTQFLSLRERVTNRLNKQGITDTRSVPPYIALPLIEAATITESDDIQELWAGLMANALDPAFKEDIRSAYISIIKDLSPLDARVLQLVNDGVNNFAQTWSSGEEYPSFQLSKFVEDVGVDGEELEISLQNLARLRCLSSVSDLDGTERQVTSKNQYWMFSIHITSLGRALLKACGIGHESE